MANNILMKAGLLAFVLSIFVRGEEYFITRAQGDFIYVGTVNRKSYFVQDFMREWLSAKSYCEVCGMELATIDSKEEIDLLRSKGGLSYISGMYWTAARDAHLPRQLSWDGSNSQPLDNITLTWVNELSYYEKCGTITLSANTEQNGLMYAGPCNGKTYTLCQTKRC